MVRTSLARGRIRLNTPALEQVQDYVLGSCTRDSVRDVDSSHKRPWVFVLPVRRHWVQGMWTHYGRLQTRCEQMHYGLLLALEQNL